MAIKILYAEDDDLMRDIKIRTLRGLHFKVRVAKDGQEAWEAYQKDKYDLLLLDLDMPNLTGEEVMRLVRERGDDIAIVIFSSVPDYHLLLSGADECIEKGCMEVELECRIKAAYERSLVKTIVKKSPAKTSWLTNLFQS